jgi:hypothetical protein
MKYVKLFEEIQKNPVIKYKLKKKFPGNLLGIRVHTLDQAYAVENEFFNMGKFWNSHIAAQNLPQLNGSYLNSKDINLPCVLYFIKNVIYRSTGDRDDDDFYEFDDYFELKHEFRGHNLKKFGV